jgi:hypothetical protein
MTLYMNKLSFTLIFAQISHITHDYSESNSATLATQISSSIYVLTLHHFGYFKHYSMISHPTLFLALAFVFPYMTVLKHKGILPPLPSPESLPPAPLPPEPSVDGTWPFQKILQNTSPY